MNLGNLASTLCPFYSCAVLVPAILISVFFGLSKRKGAKIFILLISVLSVIAAGFFNIYSYILNGAFSDYLFSFNLIEVAQASFMLFAALNIFIFIAINNFYRDNFIQLLMLLLFTVFILIFFIASGNFIMILSSLTLACIGIFQIITIINSDPGSADIKNVSEYILKNDIIRYFLVTAFSILLIFSGFSLIFGASDFKSFIQILESEKIESPLLKTGLLVIFSGIFVYLFLFPLQRAYIKLLKKCESTTPYLIWFLYFPAGIFLFLKLRNVFFYLADVNSFYISIAMLIIASVTIFGGNLGAIKTTSFRRIFSFLYLSNAGMLVLVLGFYSLQILDKKIVTWIFIINLFLAALSYFPVFSILDFVGKKSGSDSIKNIEGLARKNKYIGTSIIIILLSFAGMAATTGYIARIYTVEPFFNFMLNGSASSGNIAAAGNDFLKYAAGALAVIAWAFLAANVIRLIIILLKKPQQGEVMVFSKFYYIYISLYVLITLWIGISGLLEIYGAGIYLTGYSLLNISF